MGQFCGLVSYNLSFILAEWFWMILMISDILEYPKTEQFEHFEIQYLAYHHL